MICPNCQREVPDTAKACGYCGHWLADETEATVEVPEKTAATVALPEEKGRSPRLWIGAGLVVVALVVAVGVLAFMAGRGGGGGVDTEATLATAQGTEAVATQVPEATTPAPPAEGTSQAVATIYYDDFNDPAFDGDYDKSRWRLESDTPGDFVQEGGVLVVTQESETESATRLVAREYDFERLEAPTAFEAKLKLDSEELAGNLHLALEAEVPEGEEWWWTECTIYEDWLGCYADLGFQPEGMPVKPGTWHTVRIDVEPATMTFTYYLDGRVEGTFVPPNAEALKNAEFALKVGVWHDEREKALVGYIDDVRIGQVE